MTLPTISKRLCVALLWLVAAMVAAVVGGTLTIVVSSSDFETAGLGPLAALFVVPGVAMYLLLDFWRPGSRTSDLGFILPTVLIVASFLGIAWYLSRNPDPDGAGGMAYWFAITVVGAACSTYASLGFRRYLGSRRTSPNR